MREPLLLDIDAGIVDVWKRKVKQLLVEQPGCQKFLVGQKVTVPINWLYNPM